MGKVYLTSISLRVSPVPGLLRPTPIRRIELALPFIDYTPSAQRSVVLKMEVPACSRLCNATLFHDSFWASYCRLCSSGFSDATDLPHPASCGPRQLIQCPLIQFGNDGNPPIYTWNGGSQRRRISVLDLLPASFQCKITACALPIPSVSGQTRIGFGTSTRAAQPAYR